MEGKTKKIVSTVIGIVMTFVLSQPLLELFNNIPQSSLKTIEVDEEYLCYVSSLQEKQREQSICDYLNYNGISVSSVHLDASNNLAYIKVAENENEKIKTVIDAYLSIFAKDYKAIIIWGDT